VGIMSYGSGRKQDNEYLETRVIVAVYFSSQLFWVRSIPPENGSPPRISTAIRTSINLNPGYFIGAALDRRRFP